MVRADCFSGLFGGFDRCKLSPDHTVEFCIGAFIVSNQNLFSKSLISVSRALKRHHAKRGASAEAEVRENALHSATMFWGAKEAECRNAERERNFAKCWGFGGKYFAKFASRAS